MAVTINGTTGLATDSATADVDGFAQLSVSNDGAAAIIADRTTSDGTIIDVQKSGTSVGKIGVQNSELTIDSASTATGLSFRGAHIRPRDNGADVDNTVDLGAGAYRFNDLYLGGGVYVGGTGSSNYLSDYEHGFFEPSLLGSTSNPTVTWDTVVGQEGYYVKVGRMVHIQINFRTDTISGGSGNLYVGNLPFASPGVSGQGGMASLAVARAQDFAGEAPSSAYINEGTNYIVLEYRSTSTSGTNTSQVSDLRTTGNSNLLCISGTYYVS